MSTPCVADERPVEILDIGEWKPDELKRIATTEELRACVGSRRRTMRNTVTIWVVRHGDDAYVRSWRGAAYRAKYRNYGDSYVEPMIAPPCSCDHAAARAENRLTGRPSQPRRQRRCRSRGTRSRVTPARATGSPSPVYLDPVATAAPPSRLTASSVHFTPGARTAWHTHPYGQTIYVTEGIGRCQREGGPVQKTPPQRPRVLRTGREPLAWRGSRPVHDPSGNAGSNNNQGSPVTWGEHVSDSVVNAPPATQGLPDR